MQPGSLQNVKARRSASIDVMPVDAVKPTHALPPWSIAPTFARYLFASLPLNLHVPYMPKFWANEIVGSAGAEGGGLTPLSWLVKVIVLEEAYQPRMKKRIKA